MELKKPSKSLYLALILLSCLTFGQLANANDQIQCEALFKGENSARTESGYQFLHQRNSQLHTSRPVESTVKYLKNQNGQGLTKPADKLKAWLEYLEASYKTRANNPEALQKIKEYYQNLYLTKMSEVPESFYDLQIRAARERGHGELTLSEAQKLEIASIALKDQKDSLNVWLDYFLSKDSEFYPMWIKYWAFTGMVKLGKFDADTGSFGSRSRGQMSPFSDLNREALAIVIDALVKKVNQKSLADIKDPEFLKLLEGANFGKLYGWALKQAVNHKHFQSVKGHWRTYKQGEDHLPLVKSLQEMNTGWCTAGESTAREQLKGGAFHVYYSDDENGVAQIPRIAIRMEGNQIGEVRGTASNQNLDSQIAGSSVLADKLKDFGYEGYTYIKKDRDMKELSVIDRKTQIGIALTKEEIGFLYEIGSQIEGFGYQKDPRIAEIRSTRNLIEDLYFYFDGKFKRNEIATTENQATDGQHKLFVGDITFDNVRSGRRISLPEYLAGNLEMNALTALNGLKFPLVVTGHLELKSLKSTEGLVLPKKINGGLDLSGLKSIEGLVFPRNFQNTLKLNGLKSAVGLKLPGVLNGNLEMNNLVSAEGIQFPNVINGNLTMNSLWHVEGLKLPATINGKLTMDGFGTAEGLQIPKNLNGDLILNGLTNASGVKFPKVLKGSLSLDSLESAEGLILPEVIRGNLALHGLNSGEGLKLPENLDGTVSLHLKTLKGINIPEKYMLKVDHQYLETAEGLVLPNVYPHDLNLWHLKSAQGLKFPEVVNGSLDLRSLESVEGVILPKKINGDLIMWTLQSAKGLKLPAGVIEYHGPKDIQR